MVDLSSRSAQVLGEGGRKEQSGIGHQAVVVKDDADAVGIVRLAAWLLAVHPVVVPARLSRQATVEEVGIVSLNVLRL